jgi:GNAT superfamily N-acetyltransferase
MNHLSINTIDIREVSGKKDLDAFIQVPWEIYKDDPNWVPPLLIERKEALSDKNPWFEHAQWCAWIAYRDGKPVGRISAQIDQLHQQRYNNQTGFFGLVEAMDDDEVFKALFETAETWLREKGMRQILGPFNLGINQEIGILVEGYDSPPSVMMGHSRPYYDAAIKNCGYQSAQDLLAYELRADKVSTPKVMRTLIERNAERINVRCLRSGEKETELEVMRDIFNDAWENNWSFVPFTRKEFKAIGKELLMLLPTDYIQIAEIDNEPAAFVVMIPNLNEVIADLNGRLLPFGWAKLLWRLKVTSPKSSRVALMGVRQKYQNTRLGPALAFRVIKAATDAGVSRGLERAEFSWVLEQNAAVRNIIETIGGEITKRYRMYEKKL